METYDTANVDEADEVEALSASATSKGDPNYEGQYEAGLFEGTGVYSYPDGKAKYVGEFSRGVFHGEGSLLVSGGKFTGRWEKGKMVHGLFIFDDGLQHKKLGQKTWDYCSSSDHRYPGNPNYPQLSLHLFNFNFLMLIFFCAQVLS